MPTLIKSFLPEIFTVVLCFFCGIIGYIKGNSSCEIKYASSQINGVKENGKIEKKVMSLDDAKLDSALNNWLR